MQFKYAPVSIYAGNSTMEVLLITTLTLTYHLWIVISFNTFNEFPCSLIIFSRLLSSPRQFTLDVSHFSSHETFGFN